MNGLIVAGALLLWATGVLSAEADRTATRDQPLEFGHDPALKIIYGAAGTSLRNPLFPWLGSNLSTAMLRHDRTSRVRVSIPYSTAKLARVGTVPISERRFGLYGLAGYVSSRPAVDYLGKPLGEDEYDLSFGAGVELLGDRRNGFSLELVRQLEESPGTQGEETDRIGVGYVRRF